MLSEQSVWKMLHYIHLSFKRTKNKSGRDTAPAWLAKNRQHQMLQILIMLPYAQLQVFIFSTSVRTSPRFTQTRCYVSWIAGVIK